VTIERLSQLTTLVALIPCQYRANTFSSSRVVACSRQVIVVEGDGERGRNRTFNLLIKSQSSAHLSCCRDTP
jgi:hypothetical protein